MMAYTGTYFSVQASTPLSRVKVGSKIHVIGVCGVAMAQLSVELTRRGYIVSGSDKEFYEPMGSLLKASPIKLCHGYARENVPVDAALVVIGNAISYGHPEVTAVEELGLAYSLFPKLLFDLAIEGRHSIVISGTHGKTTTTSLCAATLTRSGKTPSYFIGGVVKDLPDSLSIGNEFSVVEGDEYDSAFFAKVPKFTFYKPQTLVVTAIEFDHGDIYPSLAAIEEEFTKLVLSMDPSGTVIVNLGFEACRRLVPQWRKAWPGKILTYGLQDEADHRVLNVGGNADQRSMVKTTKGNFSLALPGEHNAQNALATILALEQVGIPAPQSVKLLEEFQGVVRRQEVRFDRGGVTVIDDFAKHPTSVRETLKALRTKYGNRRIIAVFEPRTNTSRRKVFQKEYVDSFTRADQVILCEITQRTPDQGQALISVDELATDIRAQGTDAVALASPEAIRDELHQRIKKGDVVAIMSNGGFGGLVQMMVDQCEANYT